jgi:hypothetical protein
LKKKLIAFTAAGVIAAAAANAQTYTNITESQDGKFLAKGGVITSVSTVTREPVRTDKPLKVHMLGVGAAVTVTAIGYLNNGVEVTRSTVLLSTTTPTQIDFAANLNFNRVAISPTNPGSMANNSVSATLIQSGN